MVLQMMQAAWVLRIVLLQCSGLIAQDERELIDEFIVEALPCFKVFKEDQMSTQVKVRNFGWEIQPA